MANLTAVTGNWHQTAGLNTAFGGVATTAADNITIPTGVTVVITSGVVVACRSLTVDNGATLRFGNSTSTLDIGDATLGTGNVALSFGASSTISNDGGVPSIRFVSTNSTAQTITTNGKTLPNVTFNGVGGKWTLQDAMTCSQFVLLNGTFDTNSQDITCNSIFRTDTGTKTLTLGSSTITISAAGNTIQFYNVDPTITANTATFIILTGSGIAFQAATNMNGASLDIRTNNGGGFTVPASTWANITCTTLGAKPLAFSGNVMVTDTLTLAGTNSTTNRQHIYSSVLGTPRVITAAAVSLTDVDFMDISIVGPTGSTITSDSFDRSDGALTGSASDATDGGSGLTWTSAANITIVGNRARLSSGTTGVATVDVGTPNQFVSAKWEFTNEGAIFGLALRYTDSTNNIRITSGGSRIYGYINGSTQVFLNTASLDPNTGDVIGVAVVGNAILLYKNGTLVYTGVLPSDAPQTGNSAGIVSVANGSSDVYWDDFKVEAVPDVTGTRLGDCLGNSGIEFTTASGTARDGGGAGVKRYAVAAGNWSSTAMWSESSGGSPGASVPLPQDDVYLDANSAAGTYAINMPRSCRNLDCTGFTRTLNNSASDWSLYGNLKIVPGMTWSFTSIGPNLRGRGTQTIDTSGIVPGGGITNTNIISPGGSYTLLSNLSLGLATQSYFGHFAGTFNANGFDVTTGRIDSPGSLVRTLNLGSGTWRVGYNTSFVVSISATTSLIADSSTIIVDSTYTAERSFTAPTGSVFGTVTYTVADSPGALTITGSNTFNTINIGSGRSLKLTSGTTQKIGTLNLNGVPRGGVRLPGVVGSYLSTPDSAAVSVTGDIDIRCRVALPDYTIASDSGLVTKYGAAGQRSFRFYFDSVGRLNFNMSTDGTANTGLQWQAGPTFVDGTTYWVRTTRTAAGTLRFFYAADQPTMPTSWTEAGLSQTLSAGQNIFDSTSPVEIGSMMLGTAYLANGVFYRAQIRNNVLDDGSGIVFDTDFSPARFWPFFLDSANGAAVTPSTTLANVGDGRVVIESSTAGTGATLEVGSVTGMNYVDLKDVVMNGADTYIEATSVIRSNVKGVRRGPKTGMSMMMGV